MDSEPSNLQQAMKAAEGKDAPPAGSDVERLIHTGDRLLRVQQGRLVTARADYERRRTERVSYYRGEMQRLADEAEHELLLMQREWQETGRQIDALIGKLKAMRAA